MLLDVPSRFLFVMWEGGGNVAPQLALARKLVQRGHRVRVLADPCIREEVKAVGGEFVGFRRAPRRMDRSLESDIVRDWEARSPLGAFARIRDRIMFGPALAYAEDVLEELQLAPADLAVLDYTLLGAAAGAERAGVPIALLAHTVFQVPRPGAPCFRCRVRGCLPRGRASCRCGGRSDGSATLSSVPCSCESFLPDSRS